jgi:zeaxanthin glucosyltransferase
VARLGLFPFLGTGHLNPAIALAKALGSRGHTVTLFHHPFARAAIRAANLEFKSIGDEIAGPMGKPGRADNLVHAMESRARAVLKAGVDVVREAKIDALIVDDHDAAAGSVADILGIPFATLCLSPPLLPDPKVPPPCFAWSPAEGLYGRIRNALGYWYLERRFANLLFLINERRLVAGLKTINSIGGLYSGIAIIAHLPQSLEFPRSIPLAHLHHVGPLIDPLARRAMPFPWEKLNGRPIIFASLGTISTDERRLFELIGEAADGVDAQLVLSLGGGRITPSSIKSLPTDAICVRYAPQLEILERTAVTITHGGLNTVLESLAAGVPMVIIPIANDQPGNAMRVQKAGAGLLARPNAITAVHLRTEIQRVLNDRRFGNMAKQLQRTIDNGTALKMAADVVEQSLLMKQGVFRQQCHGAG